MGWYTVFKFLHVVFAIAWLGGGLAQILLGMRASRAGDDAESIRVIRDVIYLASRVFIPASAGALVAGVAMVLLGRHWSEEWIILGLIGFAATFATGNFIIKPRADRLIALHEAQGATPPVVALGQEILAIAKFDFVMLFTVVADMVFKPLWSDWFVVLAMVVVIVAAALLFLRPLRGPQPA